jgi:tetratricopeptide (TPR) repeat protein
MMELRTILALSPTNGLVLTRLAQLLSEQDPKLDSLARGDAEFLLRWSEKHSTGKPLEAEFRGLCLVNLGNHEAALPLLAKAIESREKQSGAEEKLKSLLLARAKAFQAFGRTAEAAADTERANKIALPSK